METEIVNEYSDDYVALFDNIQRFDFFNDLFGEF